MNVGREGDLGALFGYNTYNQLSYGVGAFAVATAYKGLRTFINNKGLIKDVYELSGTNQTKMARRFKRRRIGGRKRRNGRRSRRGGRRGGGLAKRVARISRMLRSKGIASTEIKWQNVAGSALPINPLTSARGADLWFTENIVDGTTKSNRIGAKIFIRNLRMRFLLSASSTATYPEQYVRWIIVRDKKPASSSNSPELQQLFMTNNVPGSGATQAQGNLSMVTYGWYNNRHSGRFQVLSQGMTKLVNESGAGEKTKWFKINKKIQKPCSYGLGVSTPPIDIGVGHIYMYFWSSEPSATTANKPNVTFEYRLTWTDV